jgi:hypothetical protein
MPNLPLLIVIFVAFFFPVSFTALDVEELTYRYPFTVRLGLSLGLLGVSGSTMQSPWLICPWEQPPAIHRGLLPPARASSVRGGVD